MKNLYLLLFLVTGIFYSNLLNAQAPVIEWQKSYGGSYRESAHSIQNTSDGGFIVAGSTESDNGDVTGHHGAAGSKDFWIIKLNNAGTLQWQKSLGGNQDDVAYSIQTTTDGGYIVAGYTKSFSGDVTGNHSNEADYWVVKLSSNGDIEWQKSLGGTGADIARHIEQTKDGGYIVAGYASSNNGDVTGNRSGGLTSDYWIVKLSPTGTIEWQKCFGGYGEDVAQSITETTDGGYIVGGSSGSYDGDVTNSRGSGDYWVVKLNANGTMQWQKCFGGSEADLGQSIKESKDGGYIISGMTRSKNIDVSGWHQSYGSYAYDYWTLKITSQGNIEWQKCLGGSSDEYLYSTSVTSDNSYLHTGFSSSNDGDVSGNKGSQDYWIVKQDETGTIVWQKSIGGTGNEIAYAAIPAKTGGYIIAGESSSVDGDVTGNHGAYDFWIVKLSEPPCSPAISITTSAQNICTGSPVTFTATVTNGGTSPVYQWKVNDINAGTNSNSFTSSTLNNNDVITCRLTGNAPCANTTVTVVSNSIKMTVSPLPAVTISGDSCVGNVLTAGGGIPFSSIVWKLDGNTTVLEHTAGISTGITIAGGNGAGNNLNQLNNPARFAVDKEGNMYIPDMTNNRIQKWAPGATTGITVAGGNGAGSALNQFDKPTSVAIDSKGNLYIADQNNNRMMKWAPGAASGVMFGYYVSSPTDIFIDANDNIYVSEQSNSSIKKYAAGTSIGETVFGYNGYGSGANQLSAPTGIFVDASGSIYICDTDNNRVQKWTPRNMNAITVAGGNGLGSGANQLANPLGVYVDTDGNVFVADYNNSRVQKWAPGATSGVTVAGGNGAGFAANQLNRPLNLRVNGNGELIISDYGNHRIQKISNTVPLTYTPIAPGMYTVSVVSNGCSSTSKAISVTAAKTPAVVITSASSKICEGVSVTFTASAANGGTSPLYQWKVNGVNSTSNSNNETFSSTNLKGGDVVSCEMISNATSCLTTKSATSNAITVTNAAPGVAAVKITATDTSTCEGSIITFTATPSNGGSDPNYQWKVNGINAAANNTTFSSATLKDKDVITCIITSNADLCPAALTATSNAITVQITKAALTSLSITANDTIICAGSTVNFNAVSVNSGTNPVYKWSVNGTAAGNNSATFSGNSFKNGDVVSCSLTSSLQCATPATVSSNIIKISVDEKPVISIRSDTTIFVGTSIRLNTIVTGNVSAYSWSPSASLNNSSIVSPLATPVATTIYKLAVKTPGDCQATSQVTISAITEVKISNAFSPNNDGINDVWAIPGLSSYSNCSVEIFNRYGQLVFKSIGYQKPWNGTYNGQPLAVGTYYYVITTDRSGEKKSGSVTILK